MAAMVRGGDVSPVELVEQHLGRIHPLINAFVTVREESLDEARRAGLSGPLAGVPVTVKDSFDVAGLLTRCGSRLRPETPAVEDAPAVARLRAAGAIVIGKTNTPELLASYETDNPLTGRTNHPLDPERTPGGSSGGEAAAIASGCSAGGLGSDGGGSIRVPAHFCGIAGLKPTPGRIPSAGHFPALGDLGVPGPMARTVEDLRLLFSVLADTPVESPVEARVGVWEQFYDVPIDPEIRDAVRRAGVLLGADEFVPLGLERAPNVWAVLFNRLMTEAHSTLGESPRTAAPTAEQAQEAAETGAHMRESLLGQMQDVRVIVMPVCGITAFRHGERRWNVGGRDLGLFQAMMPAVIANVLGLPAVTVPMGVSTAGLPIGVQLMGRPNEDELVLATAARLTA
jgi:Asp-tRNA(Asn)/Glu-tRNA(Gln) amidotransferase A subunit family amidase